MRHQFRIPYKLISYDVTNQGNTFTQSGDEKQLFDAQVDAQAIAEAAKTFFELGKKTPLNTAASLTLLERMIRFNMNDKKECATFWRK